MTISSARRRIVEVLETCRIDARTRSLLQKALAESWQVAPIRTRNAPPELTPHARRGDLQRSGVIVQKVAMDSQTDQAHTLTST
jgi:hypothetical protein